MEPSWSGFPLYSARHLRLLCQCLGTPIDAAQAHHLSRHILATATATSPATATATATATQAFQQIWFAALAPACTDLPAAHFLFDLLASLDHLTEELHALRSHIAAPPQTPQMTSPATAATTASHHRQMTSPAMASSFVPIQPATTPYQQIPTTATAATTVPPATATTATLDHSEQLLRALFSASQASHTGDFSTRFLPPPLPQELQVAAAVHGTVSESTVSSTASAFRPGSSSSTQQGDGFGPRIPRRNVHQLLPPNS